MSYIICTFAAIIVFKAQGMNTTFSLYPIMYDQIREDILFILLYGVVTATAVIACCYLLFRRANAFAPDVTSSVRLRRWTGAFFAFIALNHMWYMPILFLSSSEDILMTDLVGALLDSITVIPLTIGVLFVMLQDRRRPLWPIAVMVAPLIAGNVWSVAERNYALLPILQVYFLLMCIGLFTYMVLALRQYGHWLRENFADLEHKEVWQSFVMLAVMLLMLFIYALTNEGPAYLYAMLGFSVVLICYLLWRVETLSNLFIPESNNHSDFLRSADSKPAEMERPLGLSKNIGPLLKQHCEEAQLYLQYDISLSQLAMQVGINRSYLSKHFALQGITYNAYINGLRIQHFVNFYREAIATHQPVTAQQMAHQSGFRSYNTFSVAFKKVKGMTATEWMRLTES